MFQEAARTTAKSKMELSAMSLNFPHKSLSPDPAGVSDTFRYFLKNMLKLL